MRYGELVTRSWTIFWRHRYLWLLGALGGGESAGAGLNLGGGNLRRDGGLSFPNDFTRWLSDAAPLLIVLGVLLLLFAVAYFFVSCIATGATVRAVAEHDAERPFGLGPAWRAGLGTFRSILGLRLLLLLLGLVLLAVFGLIAVLGVVSAINDQPGGVVLAIVIGILLLVLLIPVFIGAAIVVPLTLRAIVLEQLGVFAALRRAFGLLFGQRFGRVLLVWLLQLALGLGVGVAAGIAALILGVPLFAVGLAVNASLGFGAALTAGAILLFVLIIGLVLLSGAANSYLSAYWTLAYRRLEVDAPTAPAYAYP